MLKGGILDDIIISYLHMGIFDKVSDDKMIDKNSVASFKNKFNQLSI